MLVSLTGVRARAIPLLDPIGGVAIAVLIARTSYEIARDTSGILSDRVVIDEDDIRRVVMSVPEVIGCHHIRTRGSIDHVFLDLHVWFPADDAAARGAPAVARREGPADGAVPADRRRHHSHRAAAVGTMNSYVRDSRWLCALMLFAAACRDSAPAKTEAPAPSTEAPRVQYISYEDARPVLAVFSGNIPAALRASAGASAEAGWTHWTKAHDTAIRARLTRGDEDSVVNFWLYGTTFTRCRARRWRIWRAAERTTRRAC